MTVLMSWMMIIARRASGRMIGRKNCRDFERMQRLIVQRRFNDHFVRAEAVARFEEPVGTHVETAFDPQHRIAVRDDAHRPSGDIRGTTLAPRQDLRPRIGLAPLTQRTRRRCIVEPHWFEIEIVSPLEGCAIDHHRTPGDRIAPQLRGYHPGRNASL